MDIYTITIAISILVYIAIGGYAGRGIKQLDDYYVAGRRAPTLIIVGTLVASLMSSTMFLGEAGFAYAGQAGPYVLFPQTACIGYVIGALFFGRYFRRSRATTVADFFGQRFNSPRVQATAGFTIILALGGYLLAVTQGAGILLSQLSDLSYAQALDRCVAELHAVHDLFRLARRHPDRHADVPAVHGRECRRDGVPGRPLRRLAQHHRRPGPDRGQGGPDVLARHCRPRHRVADADGLPDLGIGDRLQLDARLLGQSLAIQPPPDGEKRTRGVRAAIIACVVVALLQVMVYGMGGVINLGKSDIEPYESATIWASLYMLPKLLGALMLAGIVAAILSSASTFLSLVGFSASNDIGIHKSEDEKKTLFFSRMMMLVIGTAVLAAAFVFPPNIFWLTTFIATVFASSWGPVGFMSIWSKRITEAAAFWGMLSGLVFNVVPKFFEFIGMIDLPSYLDPAVIGAVASLVVTISVSRFTFVSEEERSYIRKLHETPADEISSSKTRTTYLAPAVLIANGLVMPFVLINYYVRPYQSATGMLLADGSLNWLTGEALLALSWFVIYVPLGMFAMRVIRKAYYPPNQ